MGLELRLPDWDRRAYQVSNRRSFQNYNNFAQTKAIFYSVTPVIRDEISRRTLSSLFFFFNEAGGFVQKNTKNNKRGAIVTDDVCSCEISLCSSPATWCVVLFCRTARHFFCCAQSTHSQSLTWWKLIEKGNCNYWSWHLASAPRDRKTGPEEFIRAAAVWSAAIEREMWTLVGGGGHVGRQQGVGLSEGLYQLVTASGTDGLNLGSE